LKTLADFVGEGLAPSVVAAALWNDWQKAFTSVLTQNRILEGAGRYGQIGKQERAYMAFLGIDQDTAFRFVTSGRCPLAKRDVAVRWCQQASDHAHNHGGKPWTYVLIPHDAIAENMTIKGLIARYARLEG
jgi:hypothetical protein